MKNGPTENWASHHPGLANHPVFSPLTREENGKNETANRHVFFSILHFIWAPFPSLLLSPPFSLKLLKAWNKAACEFQRLTVKPRVWDLRALSLSLLSLTIKMKKKKKKRKKKKKQLWLVFQVLPQFHWRRLLSIAQFNTFYCISN